MGSAYWTPRINWCAAAQLQPTTRAAAYHSKVARVLITTHPVLVIERVSCAGRRRSKLGRRRGDVEEHRPLDDRLCLEDCESVQQGRRHRV